MRNNYAKKIYVKKFDASMSVYFFQFVLDLRRSDNIWNSHWTCNDFDWKPIISSVHFIDVGNTGLTNKGVACYILQNEVVKYHFTAL